MNESHLPARRLPSAPLPAVRPSRAVRAQVNEPPQLPALREPVVCVLRKAPEPLAPAAKTARSFNELITAGPGMTPSAPTPALRLIECPFCSESIQPTARKCKHCGEFLDPVLRAANEARREAALLVRTAALPAPVQPAAAGVNQNVQVVVNKSRRSKKVRRSSVPHFLHFILTVITFGLWLPVWVLHVVLDEATR